MPWRKPLRRRAETLMLQTSPADINAMTPEEIQRVIYELQVHQVELELQNEQLREAQLELEESRDQYVDLYEFAPVSYITLDSQGIIIEANLTAASLLGQERRKLLQTKFSQFVAPGSQDTAHFYWQRVFDTGKNQIIELELQCLDGEIVTVRLESVIRQNPNDDSELVCRSALIDVGDLKKAQQLLVALNQDLEQRVDSQVRQIKLMANALTNLTEGVLIATNHTSWSGARINFANEAMCETLGRSAEELHGQSPGLLLREYMDQAQLTRLESELASSGAFHGEVIYGGGDDEISEFEMNISTLVDAQDECKYFVAVQRDVTQRKRAERALSEREALLQAVLDTALDAIVMLDQDGIIRECNPASEAIFGYNSDELIGMNISALIPGAVGTVPDGQRQDNKAPLGSHLIGFTYELRAMHREGHIFPISVSISEVNHLGLYTGVIHDTSQLHKLQSEVLQAAHEVQWRIGQALHDGPQQSLAGLTLLAQGLVQDLERESSPFAVDVTRLAKDLKATSKDIRSLARGLVPTRIAHGSLVDALQQLALDTSGEHEVDCEFDCRGPIDLSDGYIVDQLYLIAQEATLNAVKHSGARRITISLATVERGISIRVQDNGSGIDRDKVGSRGLGLHIMPYRAATIGATVSFSDAPGGGTVMECTLVDGDGASLR